MERFAASNLLARLTISLVLKSLWLLMPTAARTQPRLPVSKPPAIRSPQAVPPAPINISVPQVQAQDEPSDEGGTDAIAPKQQILSIRQIWET